jgi:hypothetical protein
MNGYTPLAIVIEMTSQSLPSGNDELLCFELFMPSSGFAIDQLFDHIDQRLRLYGLARWS